MLYGVYSCMSFTTQLNISSDHTNCSATEVLVNHMITLYSNCAALQTSHTFLAQTSLSFFTMLRNPVITMYANCATIQTLNTLLALTSNSLHQILDNPHYTTHTDIDGIMKKPNSNKNWCIVWILIYMCSYTCMCVYS